MDESDRDWDGLLRGGPFLEVSFLLTTAAETRVACVERCLGKLGSLPMPVTLVHQFKHPRIIGQFQEGYPYDPEDPELRIIHKAEFPLFFNFPEPRKARLYVEEIAPFTLQFDFAFYGSRFDAPEWHQRGISPGDEAKFFGFFEELFRIYDFPLGAIGYEVDCLFLFPEYRPWPSEVFQVTRFDPAKMPDNPEVEVVRWKGQYLKNNFSWSGIKR